MGSWEPERVELERRLYRTGIVVVGPIVAAAVVAWGVSDDDGSRSPVTALLWTAPGMALLFAFLGLFAGAMLGSLIGVVVGWAWGRGDFFSEGFELGGAGGAAGGALGGLIMALYATAW